MVLLPEDGTAGGEDQSVGLHLILATGEGHVQQLPLGPQLTQAPADPGLEVVPSQGELLGRHGDDEQN